MSNRLLQRCALLAGMLWLTLIVVAAAHANDASLSWTPPTQRTDGAALAPSEIKEFLIEYGACSTPGVWGGKEGELRVPGAATAAVVTDLGYGLYCFRAYTIDTGNRTSAATNVVSRDFGPVPPPKPPSNFAVAGATAYELKFMGPDGSKRVALGRDVGTVRYDVACGNYDWVDGYRQVPLESVELYRAPKSAVVVADCGES